MIDRRVARSYFTDKALGAWLGAVTRRNGAEAMVVADDDGLLIGGNIEGEEAEELAAVAAGSPGDEFHGRPLTVRRHAWQGETLYIAALGDRAAANAGIDEARTGVDRILAEGGRTPL